MLESVASVRLATYAKPSLSGIQLAAATSNSPVVSCLGFPPLASTVNTCFLVSWNQPVVVNLYQRCLTIFTSLLCLICSSSTLTLDRNKIFLPSGDHVGLSMVSGISTSVEVRFLPTSMTHSCVSFEPESLETPETKSMRLPSGDQRGLWFLGFFLVSWTGFPPLAGTM